MGGTLRDQDPYVPLAVIKGARIAEIDYARELEQRTSMMFSMFGPDFGTEIYLESLNPSTGETIRDPRPARLENGVYKPISNVLYPDSFPLRRPHLDYVR